MRLRPTHDDHALSFLDAVDLTIPMPPPGELSVRIDGTMIGGRVAFVLVDELTPGERVWVVGSRGGEGAGPCHPAFGGECLGIIPPLGLMGTANADSNGQATVAFNTPTLPAGSLVSIQAAAPRAGGAAMSHPVTFQVLDRHGLATRPSNLTCTAPDRPLSTASVSLDRVYPFVDFNNAIALEQAPDTPGWWYVAEQPGRIYRFVDDPSTHSTELVVDIRSRVNDSSNEAGLLGMAFHPDFATNGEVYLNYTANGLTTRISRFTSTDGGATFDANSEVIVLSIAQPFTNHNGGSLAFGPQGYLYIGMGDGGSANDPGDRAQDPDELLGKVLRIDINAPTYAIPPDNPWADGVGGRPEVYAIGIRNPWRFSFDSATGDLWLGDVGQDKWEEVSIIERGGNYGWKIREAAHCRTGTNCATAGLIDPVAEIEQQGFFASYSVVGGVVYRGTEIPELQGRFLYNDYYTGDIWSVAENPAAGVYSGAPLIEDSGRTLSHWTYGPDGEAYALDYNNGVYRLERNSPPANDPFPQTLSTTGCFDPLDPATPADGLIPFQVNHPFWSDGADKERWLAIPDSETIEVTTDGDFILPIGSVVVKHFRVDGDLVETRLLMRHDDGAWAGYAYLWNTAQTDADLLRASQTVILPSSELYAIPQSRRVLSVPHRGGRRHSGPRGRPTQPGSRVSERASPSAHHSRRCRHAHRTQLAQHLVVAAPTKRRGGPRRGAGPGLAARELQLLPPTLWRRRR